MPLNGVGMVTAHDDFVIGSAGDLLQQFSAFKDAPNDADVLHARFAVATKQGWDITKAHAAIQKIGDLSDHLRPIHYRPFDTRTIFYLDEAIWRPVRRIMDHFARGPNLHLMSPKQTKEMSGALVGEHSAAHKSFSAYDITSLFPLYLYPDETPDQSDAFSSSHRTLNLDPKLYAAICKAAGIDPADQAGPEDDFRAATGEARPSEVKVFDYIYGVLHAPAYRETFAEFLKIDFPRIPYPPSPEVFRQISEKGERLRRLHLMETSAIGETPYPYHGEGDDVVAGGHPKFEKSSPVRPEPVEGPSFSSTAATEERQGFDRLSPNGKVGRVHISKDQYFEGVPEIAWTFHIGGYQPAQKWLKDRRGRTLSWDDIGHYQKIVKILAETDRIMREIELPLETA